MKIEKVLIGLIFLVLGTLLLATVDQLLGIDYGDVDYWARVAHKSGYFIFGGAWVFVVNWMNRKRA